MTSKPSGQKVRIFGEGLKYSGMPSLHQHLLYWCLPLVLLLWKISPQLGSTQIPYDTLATYLPLAQLFLHDPVGFFANPLSVTVGPGTYLYMALFGAHIPTLQYANLVMAIAVLFLLFDAARRIGGRWAGMAAAWLYACSPLLAPYAIPPQSEAPFIFLSAVWFWSMAWLDTRSHAPDPLSLGRTKVLTLIIVLLGGLALGFATLTRGTYLYWIPVAVLIGGYFAWRSQGTFRRYGRDVLAVHLIAMAMVGGVLVHNHLQFERAIIATGAGGALFFGSNPVLNGYEPPYFGLMHDDASVTAGVMSHLSLEGDLRLAAVAKAMLLDMPWQRLVNMYAQKAGAILFFSKAHIKRKILNERAWRVFLLVLAGIGIWSWRTKPFVYLVLGTILYQTAVHIPALYNDRYSIGVLEIPLMILAAVGFAGLAKISAKQRTPYWTVTAIAIFGGIFAGAYHQRHSLPIMPRLDQGPHTLIAKAPLDQISFDGFSASPFSTAAYTEHSTASLVWKRMSLAWGSVGIVKLGATHISQECTAIEAYFEQDGVSGIHRKTLFGGRNTADDITFGTAQLARDESDLIGNLHLDFNCPIGAKIQLNELSLYQASMGFHYGEQALAKFKK